MKQPLSLFLMCGLLAKFSYADIPNCKGGFFKCDSRQSCNFTLGNYGGKCIEFSSITRGQHYQCHIQDGGMGVYIDALDSGNADQQHLTLNKISATELEIDTVNMTEMTGIARFAVLHGFGTGNVQFNCTSSQ